MITDEEVLNQLDKSIIDSPLIIKESQEILNILSEKLESLSGRTLNAVWIALSELEGNAWSNMRDAMEYGMMLEKEGCAASKNS